ncbi:MAG TPA: methyltransferase domain-containing protein [Mycobacteriales bacterium]|nr:methyltransferase domain-containing protein [Mycobacteriales bacterium]
MSVAPIDLYDVAISSHANPDGHRGEIWRVKYADGRDLPLAIARWCSEPDDADLELLDRCADPTLDVGCGPGRLVGALSKAGRSALGVDIAAAAVRLARVTGAAVVRRSVFETLPGEGRWGTALLADGNIGIGGEPVALLRRCGDLLAPAGIVLVELDPPGSPSTSVQVRIEAPQQRSSWFTWAHLAADMIDEPAAAAGLRRVSSWSTAGRWFACLAR